MKKKERAPEPPPVVTVVGEPDPYRVLAAQLHLLGIRPGEAEARAERARSEARAKKAA